MKIILLMLTLFSTLVTAEPASKIAWTPTQLNFVKAGDPINGKQLAEQCQGCHGENGISQMAQYPSLAGQLATYTYKQLRDFADNSREDAIMSAIAGSLNEQDSADLAAWFALLPAAENSIAYSETDKAETLVSRGDGKRTLPPCFVCHGADGEGEKMDIPALAGQRADYIEKTLNDYKNGSRHNDIYSRMRLISEQLSRDEIKLLAAYYEALKQ